MATKPMIYLNTSACKTVNTKNIKNQTRHILTVATLITGLLTACTQEPSSTSSLETPYYHTVSSQELNQQDGYKVKRRFSGTILSRQTAELNFEVSGRVQHISAFEGNKVTKGQTLALLDSKLLHIEAEQLNAQIAMVEAQMKLSDANLKRINSLIDQGYSSEQNLDELISQQQVLSANKQQLTASLDAKNYQIEHTEIVAPFTGTINKRMINIGEVVNSSMIAYEIQQIENNELKVGVPQNIIAQIQASKAFNLVVNNNEITVNELAINTEINRQSRTIQLRFPLPTKLAVFNNQVAYFEFEQFYQEPGYWVPITALTDGVRGTWNIYTLDPQHGSSNTTGLYELVSHSVEVIHTDTTRAYIRGELSTEQTLLESGLHRVVPGQIVKQAK